MPASAVVVATLRTQTEGAPGPQAAAAPRVETARRAAQSSPEKRRPITGPPGKGHGAQVSAVGPHAADARSP